MTEARGPRDKKCSKCKCYRCPSDFLNEGRELRRQCIKCRNNARDKYECRHFRVKYECKECGTVVSYVNHAAARLGVSTEI